MVILRKQLCKIKIHLEIQTNFLVTQCEIIQHKCQIHTYYASVAKKPEIN
jgi:hypothetical protein